MLADLWTDNETKFILDQYEAYVGQVGPMKKFRNKKAMWRGISLNLMKDMQVTRDCVQVENRYKTCLKRKKKAVEHNSRSGNSRQQVPFEDELSKISANDDSIEPEVLASAKRFKYLKPVPSKTSSDKKMSNQELIIKLHEEKEAAKEKRHNDKIKVLTELFKRD